MPRIDFANLETARLILRHFTDADLVPFMAYRNDPVVARYQGWEGISEAEARAFIAEQKIAQPGVPGKWFQIAMTLKQTGILVGDCALKIDEYDERQAEIGYTLAHVYQGKGIATEAVSRVLDFAFKMLRLHRVIAITDCENIASVTLLERLGLRREGHFIQNVWFKGQWADEYLYAILQDEWLGKHSTSAGGM